VEELICAHCLQGKRNEGVPQILDGAVPVVVRERPRLRPKKETNNLETSMNDFVGGSETVQVFEP